MPEYTSEYESYRDDAIAILNGVAITIAVIGTWTRPAFMGPIALVIAVLTYFMNPRSKGGTVLAVLIITFIALLETAFLGHQLA
ncbi:MAG TPA: hypothetical protein VFQ71_03850 [Gaiellales bacterium]|nr:hypothetical protein [Gaiellales bacterium]